MSYTSEKVLLDAIAEQLIDYTDVLQVIREDQDIPEEELQDPRISAKFIVPMANMPLFPELRQTADEDNVYFDIDIDYEKTLSLTVYSADKEIASGILQQTKTWFAIKQLATYFLEDFGAVVLQVLDSQERTTFLENEYQYSLGFDVRIGVTDNIQVSDDFIKSVNIDTETEE